MKNNLSLRAQWYDYAGWLIGGALGGVLGFCGGSFLSRLAGKERW